MKKVLLALTVIVYLIFIAFQVLIFWASYTFMERNHDSYIILNTVALILINLFINGCFLASITEEKFGITY